jgi:hypothetical protein
MKLCKDCKHCVPQSAYSLALCGHEKANRSPYDGCLTEVVHFARTVNGICGLDAKLFEQREPEPAQEPPRPGSICFEKYQADIGTPWWRRRIFGG